MDEKNRFIIEVLTKVNAYVNSTGDLYVVPEHLLICMEGEGEYEELLKYCGADPKAVREGLKKFLTSIEKRTDKEKNPFQTEEYARVLERAKRLSEAESSDICVRHVVLAILELEDSWAAYILKSSGVTASKVSEFGEQEEGEGFSGYAVNMNKLAREGKFSRLIGRKEELERIIQILHKKRACNPVLLGDAGSGKTAIVEGLVSRIMKGDVPEGLRKAVVWSVNLGSMIAGTKYRGEFEERLTKVINKVTRNQNAILFFDEIHTICGAGSASDSKLDASNILKPYLTNRSFRCIGAATYDEYRNTIEKDKALMRRFKKVDVKEPSSSETLEIIRGLKPEYEAFHHVSYSDEALESIIGLSSRYLTEQRFPDKAIELMDELGTKFHSGMTKKKEVDVGDVEELVSKIANVPSVSFKDNEKKLLLGLSEKLKEEIYNQDEAIDRIVRHIKMAKAGLGQKNKPLCVYGLVGSSGTGKTELVKQLAANLGISFLRFDMSEYSEQHSTAKLIGAPPGYVGFDQPGALTEAVMRHPNSVILFDEIEKADKSIYNLLLQVMDDGRLTDNNHRTVMFTDTVIFMTSNVGSREAQYAKKSIGFGGEMNKDEVFEKSLKDIFPPEFRNRFTEIIHFNDLGMDSMCRIVDKETRRLNASLLDRNIEVTLSEEARKLIAEKAMEENMGGRPVERLVNTMVAERLVDDLLSDRLDNSRVLFRKKGDKLNYIVEKKDEEKLEDIAGSRGEGTGEGRCEELCKEGA